MKIQKLILLCILSLAYYQSYSQVTTSNYTIFNNNPNCDVEIHWRVIRLNSTCSQLCNGNNVIIPASGNITINCVVANGSLIEVVLLAVAGIPILISPPAPASPYNPYVCDIFNNGTCSTTGPINDTGVYPTGVPLPCGANWSMSYNGNFTTIW